MIKEGHDTGKHFKCQLDLYPILRVPRVPSIVQAFSCHLEGTFKPSKTVKFSYFWNFAVYNERR